MDENKLKEQEKVKSKAKPFPIVAIGASAGGIAALTELLTNLPDDTGMAYVYIQHLDPDFDSALVPILQRATMMNVKKIEDLMQIEANHLFIIPPNKVVSVIDGAFKLTDRDPRPIKDSPVDVFFLSLARKQKQGSHWYYSLRHSF